MDQEMVEKNKTEEGKAFNRRQRNLTTLLQLP